jgi:hypothetical protein
MWFIVTSIWNVWPARRHLISTDTARPAPRGIERDRDAHISTARESRQIHAIDRGVRGWERMLLEYAWSGAAWSGIMMLFQHGNLIGK